MPLSGTASGCGLIILDRLGTILYCNAEATRIFSVLNKGKKAIDLSQLRRRLSNCENNGSSQSHFRYGKTDYTARQFELDDRNGFKGRTAILLQPKNGTGPSVLARAAARYKLSGRECQVLDLVISGLTTKEIASRLNLSPNTVKSFLRILMVKMGTSTRSGIVGKLVAASD